MKKSGLLIFVLRKEMRCASKLFTIIKKEGQEKKYTIKKGATQKIEL